MGIHNPDRLDRLDDSTRLEILDAMVLLPNSINAAINALGVSLLAEIRKGHADLRKENKALLDAILAGGTTTPTPDTTSATFNQPPLLATSPPPFSVTFAAGEIKEIISATTSPRRIIIKSVNGEVKLLLGKPTNIELSAVSVETNRLVDERWQGKVFGYSAGGAEILVNIEVEIDQDSPTPTPTPTPIIGDDQMPYFATQTDLTTANLSFSTGNNIILNNDIYVYFEGTTALETGFANNFELAFDYKTGAFANLTNPVYIGSMSSLKNMPNWLITFYTGKTITTINGDVIEGFENQRNNVKIVPIEEWNYEPQFFTDLLPLHAKFTQNPLIAFHLESKSCEVIVAGRNRFNWDYPIQFSQIEFSCGDRLSPENLLPGEKIRYYLFELSSSANYNGNDLIIEAIGQIPDYYGNKYYWRTFFDTNSRSTGRSYFYLTN